MKKAFSIFLMALMLLLAFSGCENAQPKQIEVDGMVFTEASAKDTAVTDENFFVRGKCVDVEYYSLLDFSTYTFTVESKIGTFSASLTISTSSYENIDTDLAKSFQDEEITILGRFSDMVSKTTNEQIFLCSHYQMDETSDPLRFTAENVLRTTIFPNPNCFTNGNSDCNTSLGIRRRRIFFDLNFIRDCISAKCCFESKRIP